MKMAIGLKRNQRFVGLEIMIVLTICSMFLFDISSDVDDLVTVSSNFTNLSVSSNYANVSVRSTMDDDDDVSHQLPPGATATAFVNNRIGHRSRLWGKRQNELKAKKITEKRDKVKNRTEYSYRLLEERRKKLLKAKEIKEEQDETKGIIPVKKPLHGRFIKNGAYNTYVAIIGILFGIAVSSNFVPKDVVIKHVLVAFVFLFLSFSLKYLVKIEKVNGKIVSQNWYQGVKISFYISMAASPLIMAHVWCIPWYSSEGIRGRLWNIVQVIAGGLWNIVKATAVGLWNIVKATAVGLWNTVKAVAVGLWNIVQAMGEGRSTEYGSSDQRGVDAIFPQVEDINDGFTSFMF